MSQQRLPYVCATGKYLQPTARLQRRASSWAATTSLTPRIWTRRPPLRRASRVRATVAWRFGRYTHRWAELKCIVNGMRATAVDITVDEIFRREAGRVLATLIRLLGDFDLAEEAQQEAFAAAVEQWPAQGVPSNPRAWLV